MRWGRYSAGCSIQTMTMHLKYLQIDYVPSPTAAAGIPWVVVAVDPQNPNKPVLVHEISECNLWIEAHDRDYMDALLADWKITPNKDGGKLLASLAGLAIGPLRASKSGHCRKQELEAVTGTLKVQTEEDPPSQLA